MTGEESVFTTQEEHEIMFHVSTLLPFSNDDKQQVNKEINGCYCVPQKAGMTVDYNQSFIKLTD